MRRSWVWPISCNNYLIEFLPVNNVIRWHVIITRVSGFCCTLMSYAGQYFTTWKEPGQGLVLRLNPVYTTPFYLSKILLNIILPPTSRSSQWSLSFFSFMSSSSLPFVPHAYNKAISSHRQKFAQITTTSTQKSCNKVLGHNNWWQLVRILQDHRAECVKSQEVQHVILKLWCYVCRT
jgi:hypothetical protein